MSDKKAEEEAAAAAKKAEEDALADDALADDPLGIGITSINLYISLGVCVCILLLLSIGSRFLLRSKSSGTGDTGDGGDDCCTVPSHYTIELKYGEGVNPYNNFALPPVIPKPPQYFG
jgi:hypothetical protein